MTVIPVSPRPIVCILTVLCCLPSLHNRLVPLLLLLHRRCSQPVLSYSWPVPPLAAQDAYFRSFRPRFGRLDSFQVIWRVSGVVVAWGDSDPHIFVGRNIPPTLIRWHNVTFHVYCTRDVPTSGQTSSWLVRGHEFFVEFSFFTSLNFWLLVLLSPLLLWTLFLH